MLSVKGNIKSLNKHGQYLQNAYKVEDVYKQKCSVSLTAFLSNALYLKMCVLDDLNAAQDSFDNSNQMSYRYF